MFKIISIIKLEPRISWNEFFFHGFYPVNQGLATSRVTRMFKTGVFDPEKILFLNLEPGPDLKSVFFQFKIQENIIYTQIFYGSRNPARNPDFQILNPERGPKPGSGWPGPLPSPAVNNRSLS